MLEPRPFRDYREQLHSVPIRNAKARLISSAPDCEVYAVALKYRGIARLVKPILGLRAEKKYELSGLGLRIFRACDGKKNFVDLIDELKDEQQLTFFEARGLMLNYLQTLLTRGLIVIIGKEEDVHD